MPSCVRARRGVCVCRGGGRSDARVCVPQRCAQAVARADRRRQLLAKTGGVAGRVEVPTTPARIRALAFTPHTQRRTQHPTELHHIRRHTPLLEGSLRARSVIESVLRRSRIRHVTHVTTRADIHPHQAMCMPQREAMCMPQREGSSPSRTHLQSGDALCCLVAARRGKRCAARLQRCDALRAAAGSETRTQTHTETRTGAQTHTHTHTHNNNNNNNTNTNDDSDNNTTTPRMS